MICPELLETMVEKEKDTAVNISRCRVPSRDDTLKISPRQ